MDFLTLFAWTDVLDQRTIPDNVVKNVSAKSEENPTIRSPVIVYSQTRDTQTRDSAIGKPSYGGLASLGKNQATKVSTLHSSVQTSRSRDIWYIESSSLDDRCSQSHSIQAPNSREQNT